MKKTSLISLMLLMMLCACGVKRDLHPVGTKVGTLPSHRHMPKAAKPAANSIDPSGMSGPTTPQYTPY